MVAQPIGKEPRTIGQVAFDDAYPAHPVEFVHELHLDDRVTLAAIADLADRLPCESVISDTAAQPLLVPQGGPPRGALERPGDVIRDLRNANAWLTLLNVEADPAMADLMNTQLDQLEAGMIATQGRMRKRVGFVFVSSPSSVTPVHFDIEHSLLMQVSGSKTVSIGCFESEAVRRHEIERYWDGSNGSHGRIEALPASRYLHLDPGAGALHTPGDPALGAQLPRHLLVGDPDVFHSGQRAREPHRGLQLAHAPAPPAPAPQGVRPPSTPPRSAPWRSWLSRAVSSQPSSARRSATTKALLTPSATGWTGVSGWGQPSPSSRRSSFMSWTKTPI